MKKRYILGIFTMMLLISTIFTPLVNPENNEIEKQTKQDKSLSLSFLLSLFNNDWDYWTNPPDMYSLHDGNVGIGTTSPDSKLEVDGVIHSITGGFKFPDGSVQTTASTSSEDTAWAWWSGTGISGDIYRMGNVGIGAITPTDKLDVYGGIRTIYIRAQANENLEFKTDDGATILNITDDGYISGEWNSIRKYHGFPHPDYDSGWRYMDPSEDQVVLTHSLGPGWQYYSFVDLIIGYPNNIRQPTWNSYRPYDQGGYVQYGFKWDHFNDYTITVTRNYDETENTFRLRIWTWS